MVDLIRAVLNMMDFFEEYSQAMDKDILDKNYRKVCIESELLLEVLGEKKVSNSELKYNSVEFKKGLHALKAMSNQLDEDVIIEDLVRSSYRKFKENSGKFMAELFECYVYHE